ncbi:MAG: rhomboid family intramembrane serine protease [Aquihabitans sp.]
MHQASVGFHCPECTKAGKQKVYQGMASLQTKPMLTLILIGINVAVFLAGVVMEGSGSLGGVQGRLHLDFGLIAAWSARTSSGWFLWGGVGHGEWYRMITSGFLHYGILHLAMNMYVLYLLGRALEPATGRLRLALIYMVSLLAGSLGALVLTPGALTVGASGAVFGLVGALFMAHRAQGVSFRDSPLLGFLVLNLIITFGLPGISIGGHLGGLMGGAFTGWLMFDLARKPGMDKRLPLGLAAFAGLACIVGGIVIAGAWVPT